MYRLEDKSYFLVLLIIPILILIFGAILYWKKKSIKKFASREIISQLAPDISVTKQWLKFICLLLAICFISLSLVNPKIGTKLETIKRQGVDIVFALDVSRSMMCEDVAPSRLDKAKLLISKVIDKLGSDRIGIIIYAGSAYPLLPITTDFATGKLFLQSANPDLLSSQGTAIDKALELSLNYFDQETESKKLMFILSDGEDHSEETITKVNQISERAIDIFTVGFGTAEGAAIPIKDRSGNTISFKTDQNGQIVVTKLNRKILEDLSGSGNGIFIDGNDSFKATETISDILKNIEKNEYETLKFSEYKDRFQWFLAVAIFLIILDIFVLEKKTMWLKKLNLFNEN